MWKCGRGCRPSNSRGDAEPRARQENTQITNNKKEELEKKYVIM